MDYDSLEDKFVKLKNAKVLIADYNLLQKDFPFLSTLDHNEINNWLINQTAYISEGQIKRVKIGD